MHDTDCHPDRVTYFRLRRTLFVTEYLVNYIYVLIAAQ